MSAAKTANAVPERPAVMGKYRPYWVEKPDGDDMSTFYPPHAQRHDINGRVTLRCQVGPDGRLNACVVRAEAPQGEGFGAAALSLSEKFRMLPPEGPAGHQPPEITIPIVFQVPEYNRLQRQQKPSTPAAVNERFQGLAEVQSVKRLTETLAKDGVWPVAAGATALAILIVLVLVLGRTGRRGRDL